MYDVCKNYKQKIAFHFNILVDLGVTCCTWKILPLINNKQMNILENNNVWFSQSYDFVLYNVID